MTEPVLKRNPEYRTFLYYSNDLIGAVRGVFCLEQGIDVPGHESALRLQRPSSVFLQGLPRRLARWEAGGSRSGRRRARIIAERASGGHRDGAAHSSSPERLDLGDPLTRKRSEAHFE